MEIAEIFKWYRDLPKNPGTTILQIEKWEKDNSHLFNKSFIGERLSNAIVDNVYLEHHYMTGLTTYYLDYLVGYPKPTSHYNYQRNSKQIPCFEIHYKILYNDDLFIDQLYSINFLDSIEISGLIKRIDWTQGTGDFHTKPSEFLLIIELSLESFRKINPRYLHAQELDPIYRHQGSLGCFITTATLLAIGKEDNCEELQAFRRFRDNWLMVQPEGPSLISEYYKLAPSIVKAIDLCQDRNFEYKKLWIEELQPCLFLINSNSHEEAMKIYTNLMFKLKYRYLNN